MDSIYLEPTANNWVMRLKANWGNLSLAALGFAPLLGIFFVISWGRPSYQFFPMALVAAGMLAKRAVKAYQNVEAAGSPRVARFLGLATCLGFLVSCLLWSPWLGYVAFLLGLITVVWSLGGKPMLKSFAPAILMLLTVLPPPLSGDEVLTNWLRRVAVGTSSSLLDWLQVTHAQDGNTLLIPGKTLLVEEACSGINSFILCNAFSLFWGLWQQRSPVWWVLAMVATSCFVVLGNIIRITTGVAAYYYRHVDLLSGRPHEIFGLILLLGYCGLILSWDQLMVFLTLRRNSTKATVAGQSQVATQQVEPAGKPSAEQPPAGSILGFKFSGAVLALAGILFFSVHLFLGGRHGVVELPSLKLVRELNFSMPASLAGWQRLNPGEGDSTWIQTFGVRSRVWNFQRNGMTVAVAIDYPLDGFHNVKNCYMANGWLVLAEKEQHNPQTGDDLHAIELNLQKSIQYAVVLHSVVDGRGNWLAAPLHVTDRFSDNVKQVASQFSEKIGSIPAGYRVQLIAASYSPPSPKTEADCLAFFTQARQLLLEQLLNQLRQAAAK